MLLDLSQFAILFAAGILGGILNSIAGGGSFITFPALLFAGVPPITANATNTFAACAGYISGTYAFRREIVKDRANLTKIIVLSLFGGLSGSFLLIKVSEQQFVSAVPWLLLVATLLFLFGDKINHYLKKMSSHAKLGVVISLLLSLFLVGVGVFGGSLMQGLASLV